MTTAMESKVPKMVSGEKPQGSSALPRGWVLTRLGEVVNKISNGITQRQEKEVGGLPVTRIETISNGKIDLKRVGYLKELTPEIVKKYRLLSGDILFSHINSDLHLGKTALFHSENLTLLHGMNLLLIRTNNELILPAFLNYLSNHYRFSGIFISIAQHAVNQSSINQIKLRNLIIPLPPLPEQHRIVDKIEELFTRLDVGVEALKKIKAQLKCYRQAVLRDAFEGKLTGEWREAHKGELETASALLERIEEERRKNARGKHKELPPLDISDLPELPEGWVWTRLGAIVESMQNGIYKQRHFYSDGGVACLRMYNIEEGKIVWKDIKRMNLTVDEVERYGLRNGDILVNRVNSRELVGKAASIPSGLETCVYESKNIRIRLLYGIESKYIAFWFQVFAQVFFNKNAQQTVGMASINQEQIASMPIPFTVAAEQQLTVSEIERRFSIADEIEGAVDRSLKQAGRLRQSILKQAFKGKLVPQDPNDEPAEKLLERIREEKAKQQAENNIPKSTKRRTTKNKMKG